MIIYLLYCRKSNKGYVGRTIRTLEERLSEHESRAREGSPFLIHRAIRKYGFDSFDKIVLATTDNLSESDSLESDLIESHKTLVPNGYNLTEGGDGLKGYKHSPEIKEKLRLAQTGKTLSLETRLKISDAMTNDNPFLGRTHSEESKSKISKSKKGSKMSDDTKTKISEKLKGRILSDNWKNKISLANKGRVFSAETRLRMSEAAKRRNKND